MKKGKMYRYIPCLIVGALFGQGNARAGCSTPEEVAGFNSEVVALKKEFDAFNLENASQLNKAVRQSLASANALAKCSSEMDFASRLLGYDCSTEKDAAAMYSAQVEMLSNAAKSFNNTVSVRIMLIRSKYPSCR